MTITVTALRWLTRETLPYALLRVIELWWLYALLGVIDLWWLYALLGVIDLWWLYGWHVGVTALFAFYGIAGFVLYKKKVASPSKPSQARDHL